MMTDILIRNIASNLKRDIENRAKRARRSLSDEIKHLIRAGLAQEERREGSSAGDSPLDAMRRAFAGAQPADEEQVLLERTLEESRKQSGRAGPEFE